MQSVSEIEFDRDGLDLVYDLEEILPIFWIFSVKSIKPKQVYQKLSTYKKYILSN